MKRHDDVGTRPYCSHFLRGNASPCRPVPPLSHKSKAFAGTLRSPYGGRTGHPQITNICLASRASLGRAPVASEHALFCSVFVGATLRGRPFRNVNFTGRSRTSPLRNPRQSEKGFSSRLIRALDETSHFRATTWGRPYGGRTGHPRITNIYLASRASLGRAPAKRQRRVPPGDHIGSPLRRTTKIRELQIYI